MKKSLRPDMGLLRAILVLSWPTVVEQTLQTGVMYVDTALVGRIGADASAAVGLTATTSWLIIGCFSAMGMGVLSCVSRAIGARDYERAGGALVQSIILSLALGTAVALLAVAVSPSLPRWLGAEPEIEHNAYLYFFITSLAAPLRAAAMIMGAALRSTGDTKTPMRITLVAITVKMMLSVLLIGGPRPLAFGGLTLPGAGLGVCGAAIASASCFAVNGILMLLAVVRSSYFPKERSRWRADRAIMRECVSIGLPITAQKTMINLGNIVFTALVARLGTIAVATHSIAITAEEAFYIPGYGMQVAAATMAGNAVGERDERRLRACGLSISAISAGVMTLLAALLFAFSAEVMSIFSNDPLVIAGGAVILRIVALSEPLFAVSVIMEGVFNGVGDVRMPFVISVLSMWCIRVFFTWLCVAVLGFGLESVWVCMVADNVAKCILLTARFLRLDWTAFMSKYEMPSK